ncbi:MAG: hypothetical protein WBS24_06585 [Terriglobales bacterium]
MSLMKSMFVVLLLTAAVCIVPQAQATVTIEVTMAGSSGAWQALGIGTYNYCVKTYGSGNCFHWTSASNVVNLTDTRVTPVNNDAGTIWIVWEGTASAATKLWSDDKVDSVVGNRCFWAQPQCNVNATGTNLAGSGAGKIASAIWGADTALPSNVVSIFQNGTILTALASDIRPEDAAFESCRVNSALGAGSYGGGASDGLDGLGYNTNNTSPGACVGTGLSQAHYVGSQIKSAYPSSGTIANVLAFAITGNDPISGTAIPTASTVEVGADPVIFFFERDKGQLTNLQNVSPQELQQAFSGTNCDANAFGLPTGNIGIFLREPLSGTMITSEFTSFRGPTLYDGTGGGGVLGISQEANVGSNNPLNAQSGTCLTGSGARYRGVGTSDMQNWVKNSGSILGTDGIGYQFFSFGNFSPIAGNANYGYATINNVDPIFASYGPQISTGNPLDPGQPNPAGTTPGAGSAWTAACPSGFPCPEKNIWAGGLSFPHVRDGSYKAWSMIRVAAYSGTTLTNLKNLVKGAQVSFVDDVPDMVPAVKTVGSSATDPGLLLVRSHFQQYDGSGNTIGAAPVNAPATEKGGDAGGYIYTCATLTTCPTTTHEIQGNSGIQSRP